MAEHSVAKAKVDAGYVLAAYRRHRDADEEPGLQECAIAVLLAHIDRLEKAARRMVADADDACSLFTQAEAELRGALSDTIETPMLSPNAVSSSNISRLDVSEAVKMGDGG